MAAVALIALPMVGGMLVARQRRLEHWQALNALRRVRRELAAARTESLRSVVDGQTTLDEVLARCQAALQLVTAETGDDGVAKTVRGRLSAEEAGELRRTTGELRQLIAMLTAAQARLAPSKSSNPPPRRTFAFDDSTDKSPHELGLATFELSMAGRFHEALPQRQRATRDEPGQAWIWHGLALSQAELHEWDGAIASLTACVALAPELADAYAPRGVAHFKRREFAAAEADFQRARSGARTT